MPTPSELFKKIILSLTLIAAVCGCNMSNFRSASDGEGKKPGRPIAPGNRDGGSGGRPSEGDESLPGYLLNLDQASVRFDPSTSRVAITASPGVFVAREGGALLTAWEASPEILSPATGPSSSMARLPAVFLGVVHSGADGSMQGNFAYGRSGLVLISTTSQPTDSFISIPPSGYLTAAYTDPLTMNPLRGLAFDQLVTYGPANIDSPPDPTYYQSPYPENQDVLQPSGNPTFGLRGGK